MLCVQIFDVTDKILPRIEDCQNRPLDEVYPILYIDAIHYSVRDNGVIRSVRNQLYDIRKAYQRDELLKALESSHRSYDDILAFITSSAEEKS